MKSIYLVPLLIFGSLLFETKPIFANTNLCSEKILSGRKLVSAFKPNVVVVYAGDFYGTGFVIGQSNNKTFILTNKHVVDSEKKVSIKWSDGSLNNGAVIKSARNSNAWKRGIWVNDMALISINGIKGSVLPIKKTNEFAGENVIAIGTPKEFEFTVTRGIVSAVRERGQIIQTDAAINKGNSGGPLINSYGCVVGINTYIYRTEEGEQGLNFAVSSERIIRFLNNAGYAFLQDKFIDFKYNNIEPFENNNKDFSNDLKLSRDTGSRTIRINFTNGGRSDFINLKEDTSNSSRKRTFFYNSSDDKYDLVATCGKENPSLKIYRNSNLLPTDFNNDRDRQIFINLCNATTYSNRVFLNPWEKWGTVYKTIQLRKNNEKEEILFWCERGEFIDKFVNKGSFYNQIPSLENLKNDLARNVCTPYDLRG